MKNLTKFLVIIVIGAVIGFSLAGCDNSVSGSGGTETPVPEPGLGELTWYVSNTGSDSADGLSSGAALATVGKALALIQTGYNRGSGWPLEPDNTPRKATIVIQGTVTADTGTSNGMVEISGTNAYPPVELRGPAGGTGTLNAAGKNKRVLYIADGNSVTLGDHLTLTGGSSQPGGGEISGITASGDESAGGGVYAIGRCDEQRGVI